MPVPTPAASWMGSLFWLIGLSVAAVAVSWLFANRLRIGRPLYIGVLFLVTGALSAGYVAWLGLGAGEVLTTRWGWGLLAAPIAGAFPAFGMTQLPACQRPSRNPVGRPGDLQAGGHQIWLFREFCGR